MPKREENIDTKAEYSLTLNMTQTLIYKNRKVCYSIIWLYRL
jgi:hypothetical protein